MLALWNEIAADLQGFDLDGYIAQLAVAYSEQQLKSWKKWP